VKASEGERDQLRDEEQDHERMKFGVARLQRQGAAETAS
jgi:hypothetical protein